MPSILRAVCSVLNGECAKYWEFIKYFAGSVLKLNAEFAKYWECIKYWAESALNLGGECVKYWAGSLPSLGLGVCLVLGGVWPVLG